MAKVYVVTGEYQESRNGEVAWVVGVAQDEKTARQLAEQDAESFEDADEVFHFPGDDDWDWTIYYEWNTHEVQG